MEKTEPSAKERAFIDAYERTWNATEAALMAGYGKGNRRSGAVIGSRLLKKEHIRAAIEQRRREEYEALNISKETLTGKLATIMARCMEGTEHLSWNQESHQYEPDGTWMMDTKGALKAAELLGKSIGMFEDKVQLGASLSVEQYLQALESPAEEF